MDGKVVVYTRRYMWKLKNSDSVNFKIFSDTEVGHAAFIKQLKLLPDLEKASYEYLHEYDVSKIGVFVDLAEGGVLCVE